ncbi:MAG: hypothetical protein FWF57_00880 [Defluviitaleaceae bacterium]|nr:hypothetical protein [Defluviitaleaceae bacterium]
MYDYQSEVLGLQALEAEYTEIDAFKSSTPVISSQMCGEMISAVVTGAWNSSVSLFC